MNMKKNDGDQRVAENESKSEQRSVPQPAITTAGKASEGRVFFYGVGVAACILAVSALLAFVPICVARSHARAQWSLATHQAAAAFQPTTGDPASTQLADAIAAQCATTARRPAGDAVKVERAVATIVNGCVDQAARTLALTTLPANVRSAAVRSLRLSAAQATGTTLTYDLRRGQCVVAIGANGTTTVYPAKPSEGDACKAFAATLSAATPQAPGK